MVVVLLLIYIRGLSILLLWWYGGRVWYGVSFFVKNWKSQGTLSLVSLVWGRPCRATDRRLICATHFVRPPACHVRLMKRHRYHTIPPSIDDVCYYDYFQASSMPGVSSVWPVPLFVWLLSSLSSLSSLSLHLFAFSSHSYVHGLRSNAPNSHTTANTMHRRVVLVAADRWRSAAAAHAARIRSLLEPGLLLPSHHNNSNNNNNNNSNNNTNSKNNNNQPQWTGLDPQHPVYNFLIEYYGLKGAKGPRRLARWSPDPAWLFLPQHDDDDNNNINNNNISQPPSTDQAAYQAVLEASHGHGGILLQGAGPDDFGDILSLRGATPVPNHGVLYHPRLFYNHDNRHRLLSQAAPFQWYRAILQATLTAEPVLHCHGLHEWAMLYQPPGAPPPPSAVYQATLPLRVPRNVINDAVERRGVHCTHVDALRFFAPAAGPFNVHGATLLPRTDQLRLEQPACVHAHMDLLKIVLKLQPFVDSALLADVLELALDARRLDVAASPYDVAAYLPSSNNVPKVVPVETRQGRKLYRQLQTALMDRAEPVRRRLWQAYETFLSLAFDPEVLNETAIPPSPRKVATTKSNHASRDEDDNHEEHEHEEEEEEEVQTSPHPSNATAAPFAAKQRYAVAEPGGQPWRRNLVAPPSVSSVRHFSSSGKDEGFTSEQQQHALFLQQMEELKAEREALFGHTPEEQNAWGNAGNNHKHDAAFMETIRQAREQLEEEEEDNGEAAMETTGTAATHAPPTIGGTTTTTATTTTTTTTATTTTFANVHSPEETMVLTHLSKDGKDVNMVDVGSKAITSRVAVAESKVVFPPEVLESFSTQSDEMVGPKGPIFATAKIAGIMAAK